jgi:ABC-type branched-subunit amino acid transport system substrate-binding protein
MAKTGLRTMAAALVAACVPFAASQAQEAYVIGATAAMTGPAAGTQAPVIAALRVYISSLNARGGVNGHPVKLILLDDQAEPSKAAANATALIEQDKVVLFINSSLSSTYAPTFAVAKRAQVPIYLAGAVCPKEVYPPADPLEFCSTAFGSGYDSRMALSFVKGEANGGAKIGFAAMAIPISRAEMDYARSAAKDYGLTPLEVEVIPPPTADYTPFATKLKEAGADWVLSWAPWVTQVKTFEALRRLDWKGKYIAYAHIQAEDELARLKDGSFYVFGANALFQDKLPVFDEIRAALAKDKIDYPDDEATEGWVCGLVLEAVLKGAGWPATPAKVQAAMSNLNVDTKGLRGGPIVWTKDNHFRTQQYYRVYRWDPDKGAVARVKDWTEFDVK